MIPPDRDLSYSEARSNADDVELLRRIGDADEAALGALYDQWSHALYSLVLNLVRDPDEAEDIVEETFWQAWRHAGSYEPSRGAVSTWLLTIGRRNALDRLRARKRHRDHPRSRGTTFVDTPSAANAHDTDLAERYERVRSSLRGLPAEQRDLLEMGYFDGIGQAEIAEVTGLPMETVRTRVRLAMQKLREPLSTQRP